MRKICVVAIRKPKISVRIITENGDILETREGVCNTAGAIVGFLRNILQKQKPQDIVLGIADDALYYRLKSEQERNTEQLRTFWDIPAADYLATLRSNTGGKNIYYGLRYARETIEFYVHVLKKLPRYNGAVIPLDFLYYQTGTPAFLVNNKKGRAHIRLFDGQGAYFYKTIFLPTASAALDKLIGNISHYVSREKISENIPPVSQTEYTINDVLPGVFSIPPENLLYFNDRNLSQQIKTKLKFWQKTLLCFLVFWILGAGAVGLSQGYRAYRLLRSIRAHNTQYGQIANRVQELRYVEADTRDLLSRDNIDSEAGRLILRQAAEQRISLKEVFFEKDRRLFYIIGLDRAEDRNQLITSLRRSGLFSALNPIYFQPIDDTLTEFKLMLTVK